MKKNQFGNPEKYKVLKYIVEKVDEMPKNEREYISNKISNFNLLCKKIKKIDDIKFKKFIIDRTKNYYNSLIIKLQYKYEQTFVSHLKNFFIGKLRNILKNK